jgi:ABC-type polysaccharide/polyol phosphate transport system ATPase subunit
MTSSAIEFETVSKRYVIRHKRTGYLKDRLTNAVLRLNPFWRKQPDETVEDFWALKDLSFRIQPGESVGIIGPNGSGKSTTLKILAGVTQQTSGRVSVNGKLGALIEVGAGFHPELSGRENVFLNGSILGMKKAEIARKFDAIVAFAEVEQFIDTPVKHYSSGMYVRLGFAIAIHNNPEILLIDEVLSVGDLVFQRKCFEKMRELKESGRTIVLISHAMSQIESMCERAILLRKGKLLADGPAHDVAQQYVAVADTAASNIVQPGTESGMAITAVRLLDANGEQSARCALGSAMVFEIDFDARRPITNAVFSIHLSRGHTRVYDSDTDSVGIRLGTLSGRGTLRCEIPNLSLTPNSYSVQVLIYDCDHQPIAHLNIPNMFSVSAPADRRTMGCSLDDAAVRAIVFARATWRKTTLQSTSLKTPQQVD